MSGIVESLIEMGFSKEKAEIAVKETHSDDLPTVMDWILAHEGELDALVASQAQPQNQNQSLDASPPPPQPQSESHTAAEPATAADAADKPSEENPATQEPAAVAKSIKCDDCGKLFQNQDEVEFHATKSGHENFSESTEEKKALTEEEKKEQLAKIEAKLRQRRLDREAREKQEALERERIRIKSGKEMLEAKKKHEELEMKKILEQRKREKEEEKQARQRVREQIEQDKLARKAKFSAGGQPTSEEPQHQSIVAPSAEVQQKQQPASRPPTSYSEVMLQIRLTNGLQLVQKFGAKEPLSAVRLFVEMNRKDGDGPFSLMMPYPKKVFGPEDYDVPLESLGLGPRATLIVSKS